MNYEKAIFAAGCFWGVEAAYGDVAGIMQTEVGYIGGTTKNPSYHQVCTGTTNHAEAVRITFDPTIVTYEKLLDIFWNIHDPTTPNRQGPDYGTQYRSAIFFTSKLQEHTAQESKILQQKLIKKSIVTEIVPATEQRIKV